MSAGEEATNLPEVVESIDEVGEIVNEISIEIDYAIIEHFSEHLYGSPNKAVEELVSNGFDAFASRAYVYLPGRFTRDCVLVWDDGDSMDIEDLKKLWWIARSPKNVGDRIVTSSDGRRRAMIGKFGIGKLASYAVGHRIAHLCRRGHSFFHVAVDYREVPALEEGEARKVHKVFVRELKEDEARSYVSSLFDIDAGVLDTVWDEDSWTLAIIDELKEEVSLTGGRLRWVLGNGMPLRPDFNVWVDDEEVEPKLGKDAAISWDLSEPKLLKALNQAWESALKKGQVDGKYELLSGTRTENGKPAIHMPELGDVSADVMLFNKSLRDSTSPDVPRSYGFFVMVRDRLLNPDEDRLLLSDPSFGAFYRCQFVIHVNGLDKDLLADRERLRADTPRTREFAVLQRALYLASRHELETLDEDRAQAERSESLLPVESREFFREPLTALLLRNEKTSLIPIDLASPRIERTILADSEPLSILDEEGELQVNTAHPLFESVRIELGNNNTARKALQVLDLFAVSERLLEGFLYDLGLPDDQIEHILKWRDGLFRTIAARFGASSLEEVVREVRDTSYKGDRPFERALEKMFSSMGFETQHDGISGKKDVLVMAPVGEEEFRLVVEAKGSKNAVRNDDADISGAARHRDQVGASLAVVVAREFAGFERVGSEPPAVLGECRSTKNVSIATVEVLEALHKAVHEYGYPLTDIYPVLAEIESPAAKLDRVRKLQYPTEDFDYRGILDKIWDYQQGEGKGNIVPSRAVWQSRQDRWGVPEFEDFNLRLVALSTLSGLLKVVTGREQVTLQQNPEIVVERIQLALKAKRYEEAGADDIGVSS